MLAFRCAKDLYSVRVLKLPSIYLQKYLCIRCRTSGRMTEASLSPYSSLVPVLMQTRP